MFRPEGWVNPYKGKEGYDYCRQGADETCWDEAFEAGADAMLRGLREQGTHGTFYANELGQICSKDNITIFIPEGRGTLVFIPDEEA